MYIQFSVGNALFTHFSQCFVFTRMVQLVCNIQDYRNMMDNAPGSPQATKAITLYRDFACIGMAY